MCVYVWNVLLIEMSSGGNFVNIAAKKRGKQKKCRVQCENRESELSLWYPPLDIIVAVQQLLITAW